MRRWIVLCLALALGWGFVQGDVPQVETAPALEAAPTIEPTPEPTPVPTPVPTPTPTPKPKPKKRIALTFDDGPGAATRRILKALDEVDGRATFFMLGERMGEYAATARAVAAQGSEIGTHSWNHPNLAKLSAAQVRRQLADSISAIERASGVRPKVLRPPYGSVSETLKQVCRDMGLVIANWNIDPEDWRVLDADAVYRHILKQVRDGAIVVLHDIYPSTARAVEMAIEELDRRGYELVTVSEILKGASPGKVYFAG